MVACLNRGKPDFLRWGWKKPSPGGRVCHATGPDGILASVVGEATAPAITQNDILIILSGSGETPVLLEHGKKAKKAGAGTGDNGVASFLPVRIVRCFCNCKGRQKGSGGRLLYAADGNAVRTECRNPLRHNGTSPDGSVSYYGRRNVQKPQQFRVIGIRIKAWEWKSGKGLSKKMGGAGNIWEIQTAEFESEP